MRLSIKRWVQLRRRNSLSDEHLCVNHRFSRLTCWCMASGWNAIGFCRSNGPSMIEITRLHVSILLDVTFMVSQSLH